MIINPASAVNAYSVDPKKTTRPQGQQLADQVQTSEKAKKMAKEITLLSEELLPREAVLKKYMGSDIDAPIDISDDAIDQILSKI